MRLSHSGYEIPSLLDQPLTSIRALDSKLIISMFVYPRVFEAIIIQD